jgi:hypothetical protein
MGFAGPFVKIDVGGSSSTWWSTASSQYVVATRSCSDNLLVANGGRRAATADPTAFTGSLSLSGSCLGAAGTCISDQSGGYTYSLSATGRQQAPEPGTLILLGAALAGLGWSRRKQA